MYGFILLSSFLFLGGQSLELGKAPRVDPGPDCWYEDMCRATGDNTVDAGETGDLTALECYELCKANADCTDFSWNTFYNGHTRCELLTSCTEKYQCSGSADSCISGPKDCAVINPCPALTYLAGDAVWSCPNQLNPYKEQIPNGYTCTTSCGGWLSVDEEIPIISASSTCENGQWSAPVTSPAVAEANLDAAIKKPDENPKCACRDFNLWYNPNDELGADFFCTKTTDFSAASPSNIITLDPTEECILMCDNYIVADIMCANGEWSDADPEFGIACFKAPDGLTTHHPLFTTSPTPSTAP